MEATVGDWKVAGLAAGFSLGFGFLTVWKAIKQTRSITQPHRSTYVILVWAELFANFAIGILAWIYLEEIIPPGFVLPLSCFRYIVHDANVDPGLPFPFFYLHFGSLKYNAYCRLS